MFKFLKTILKNPVFPIIFVLIFSDPIILTRLEILTNSLWALGILTVIIAFAYTICFKDSFSLKYKLIYSLTLPILSIFTSILYMIFVFIAKSNPYPLQFLLMGLPSLLIILPIQVFIKAIIAFLCLFITNKLTLVLISVFEKINSFPFFQKLNKKLIFSLCLAVIIGLFLLNYYNNFKTNHLSPKELGDIEIKAKNSSNLFKIIQNEDKKKLIESVNTYRILIKNQDTKYLSKYLISVNALAGCYSQKKDSSSAARVLTHGINDYEKIISKNPDLINRNSIRLYDSLANSYNMADYKGKAIELEYKALDQAKKLSLKSPKDKDLYISQIKILESISRINAFSGNNDYNEFRRIAKEKIALAKRLLAITNKETDAEQYLITYLTPLSYSYVKVNQINEAKRTYDDTITYFETKYPQYKGIIATILIKKNSDLYKYLSKQEIDDNFNKSIKLSKDQYSHNNAYLNSLISNYERIAEFYNFQKDKSKGEKAYLEVLNFFNSLSLEKIESIKYLKYRYIGVYDDIIKYYVKNDEMEKARKIDTEKLQICAYLAKNDPNIIKYCSNSDCDRITNIKVKKSQGCLY